MSRLLLLVLVFVFAGCAKAPLTIAPSNLWQANEVVVAINTLQYAAIELNALERCAAVCQPVLSDASTGLVVDVVAETLVAMQRAPARWRTLGVAALDRIDLSVDADGKARLAPYVRAARTTIAFLLGVTEHDGISRVNRPTF